jgi:hypothetical protein
MVIFVAQIQQIRPTSDANPDVVLARERVLVPAVPAWVEAQSRPESGVFVADLWTNSDTTQTPHGMHADDVGAHRMGRNWLEALKGLLAPD